MRKRVGVSLAILFVLFCVSLGLASSKDKSGKAQKPKGEVITIDALMPFGALERSAVRFPHEQHTAAMPEAGCLSCHETKQDAKKGTKSGTITGLSFQFKRQASLGKEALKDLYHNACIGCHADRALAKQSAGPQTCNACHVKAVAEPTIPPRKVHFGPVLHASHAEKASLECSRCHHAYNPAVKKAVHVKGEEGACVYCHKERVPAKVPEGMPATTLKAASHDQCLNCHLETAKTQQAKKVKVQTGPVACDACHAPVPAAKIKPVTEKNRLKRNQPDAVVIGAKTLTDKMLVPFNHKAHEMADISCQSCHHKSLAACTECHTVSGSEKGGNVTLEAAMHTRRADRSCIACHAEAKKAPECAGCHQVMLESRPPDEESCTACHSVKKTEGAKLPEGAALVSMVAARGKMKPSVWRKNAPEKVSIKVLAREYQPALFPHKKVVDALSKGVSKSGLAAAFHGSEQALCQGCHHNAPATEKPASCASCHSKERQAKSGAKPDLMAAFHMQCMECHNIMNVELKGDCNACHAALVTPASKK